MNSTTQVQKTDASAPAVPQAAMIPPVDILESEVGITLMADMPGVSRDRLGVRVTASSW